MTTSAFAAPPRPRPTTTGFLLAAVLVGCLSFLPTTARADWPTLHRDYQRSGHTSETLNTPIARKWYRSFVEEMIGARVEPIVAEGLCFVGTYAGNLHALKVEDGSTAWTFAAGGPIGHSPAWDQGRLYVATDVGAGEGGRILCLEAATGRLLWEYAAEAGFWTSPAVDGDKVYAGDRSGIVHALHAASGELAWTFPTGGMILKPASLSTDRQKIVVGSEDMHLYCLSPQGELLWKSAKLQGLSQRDQAPTIWQDKVIVRTNPAWHFHESLYAGRSLLRKIQAEIPADPDEDQLVADTDNYLWYVPTDRREQAQHREIVRFLRENPHLRTWFTFDLIDGTEPWITSVLFQSGMHNPPSPPTFHPETGELYTLMPTSLGVYVSGVSQTGMGVGRIDPETGYLTNLPHAYGATEPGYFSGMAMITDETSTIGLMRDFLVVTHQGAVGGVDLTTRQIRQLHGRRDTYGGLFGPGAAPGSWDGSKRLAHQGYVQNTVNEWHGPDRSMAAITGGRAFWVVGGSVVCFGGPEIPAAESGGSEPPPPWKWSTMPRIDGGNVTSSLGTYRDDIPRLELTLEDLKPYLDPPPPVAAEEDPQDLPLREKLDAAVQELIEGHPWRPWILELGISKQQRHFARSAETIRTVALALPHLSPEVRDQAIGFLDRLFEQGHPLETAVLGPGGTVRELYDVSPPLLAAAESAPRHPAELADLYALWAYAHYADRWEKVLPLVPKLIERFGPGLAEPSAEPLESGQGRGVRHLNGQIAGLVAYLRILRQAQRQAETADPLQRLREAAEARVHFERAEQRLQTIQGHRAEVPRYIDLVPEVARLLADHAGDPLEKNIDDLSRQFPIWYQAWAERLIGGENYITPPHLSRGIFAVMADGLHRSPTQLARYLDQPWTSADLYYIEKLTATLRQSVANQGDGS